MLRQTSSIIDASILELDSGNSVGKIRNLITDPQGKKIMAFLVSPSFPFGPNRVLAPVDIVEYGPQIIIIRNKEALIEPSEIATLTELIKQKITPLNKVVLTLRGKRLGIVEDLVIEENGATIVRYYLKPSLITLLASSELILPADNVIQIEKNRVLAKDNGLKTKESPSLSKVVSKEPAS